MNTDSGIARDADAPFGRITRQQMKDSVRVQAHLNLAGRETEAMAKINWDRARGGDDDFAAVGEEPTIPARYAGTCATCGRRFTVGDPIASVIVNKKPTYHHGACRYPATALLSQNVTEADVDAVGAARSAPRPGKCRATTNKGRPCNHRVGMMWSSTTRRGRTPRTIGGAIEDLALFTSDLELVRNDPTEAFADLLELMR